MGRGTERLFLMLRFELRSNQSPYVLLGHFSTNITTRCFTTCLADPMVDVMSALGDRTGISSFYISFLLAPLASNASELIAAFKYSLKKTSRTIVVSFAALQVRIWAKD